MSFMFGNQELVIEELRAAVHMRLAPEFGLDTPRMTLSVHESPLPFRFELRAQGFIRGELMGIAWDMEQDEFPYYAAKPNTWQTDNFKDAHKKWLAYQEKIGELSYMVADPLYKAIESKRDAFLILRWKTFGGGYHLEGIRGFKEAINKFPCPYWTTRPLPPLADDCAVCWYQVDKTRLAELVHRGQMAIREKIDQEEKLYWEAINNGYRMPPFPPSLTISTERIAAILGDWLSEEGVLVE